MQPKSGRLHLAEGLMLSFEKCKFELSNNPISLGRASGDRSLTTRVETERELGESPPHTNRARVSLMLRTTEYYLTVAPNIEFDLLSASARQLARINSPRG